MQRKKQKTNEKAEHPTKKKQNNEKLKGKLTKTQTPKQ